MDYCIPGCQGEGKGRGKISKGERSRGSKEAKGEG